MLSAYKPRYTGSYQTCGYQLITTYELITDTDVIYLLGFLLPVGDIRIVPPSVRYAHLVFFCR